MQKEKLKKIALVIIAIAVVLLIYRFAERIITEQRLKKNTKTEVITVTVEKVKKGKFERFLKLSGTVNPYEEAKVTAKFGGKIVRIYKELGDKVKNKEPLFEIDPVDLKIVVLQAEADYFSAKASYEIAKDDLNRVSSLYKEKIVSDQLYKTTASKERSAYYILNSAKSRLNLAKQRLNDSTVKSPFNGVVTAKLQSVGNSVNDSTPVIVVTDTKTLKLTSYLSEKDLVKVKVGQTIDFKTSFINDKTFQGKVKRISPRFLESTRQSEIEIEIDNSEYLLRPGIFVEGNILIEKVEDALLIPKEAVVVKDGKGLVFKTKNGTAEQVSFDIVSENESYYLVRDAIKDGEEIVVKGASLLSDGTKVNVEGIK